MRQIDIGDGGHALLVRENGAYTAVGHKCTHYGAPLIKGSLMNGRVRCPWHGACFNVHTGDIEDFPGLDSIPKFEVGDVKWYIIAVHSMIYYCISYVVELYGVKGLDMVWYGMVWLYGMVLKMVTKITSCQWSLFQFRQKLLMAVWWFMPIQK